MYKRSCDRRDPAKPISVERARSLFENRFQCRHAIAAMAAMVFLCTLPAAGQTGPFGDVALRRLLARPVTLSWHGQTLGPALERLAASQELPLWIDRRIDRSAPLEMDARGVPLSDALNQVAATQQAAATTFRGVVYFGPAPTAGELATLAERARLSVAKAPVDRRQKWLASAPWSFSRLSQPRQLLEQLAAETGAKIASAEAVPHDLWAAQELPPMAAIDRAVLLLAGFDLTCEVADDGAELRIVPIPTPVAGNVRALASGVPPTTPPSRERRPVDQLSRAAFTLKLDNRPVSAVLDQLAGQLNLELAWAENLSAEARKVMTTCDVRNVTLDELLAAVLNPAGLTFQRTDRTVEIRRQD
jgi:hypothetical protein